MLCLLTLNASVQQSLSTTYERSDTHKTHVSVFQLPTYADIAAWHCPHSPGAAAERRPRSNQSICSASKPAEAGLLLWGPMLGQTDGRTDTVSFHRSSAGQGKFAGQRPTFYHCATPPTPTNTQNPPIALRNNCFNPTPSFFHSSVIVIGRYFSTYFTCRCSQ